MQPEGHVAPGFEPVREAFERCFGEMGEEAASFAGWHRGELVAALRGGRFGADSLVNVYSAGKALSAFCVLILADRGELELDLSLAGWWPEYGQAGKRETTVRQMLAHQSGLVGLRDPLPAEALFDWDLICSRLAAEEPWFEPGTAHGESILFYGHLCGELVRRIDGRSLGAFWREVVAEPWGIDFHFGLGEGQLTRVLDLEGVLDPPTTELALRAFDNPPGARDLAVVNGESWRRAEIPAINGHGNADALGRFYLGLQRGGELDGVRLVSEQTVEAMRTPQMTAIDAVLGHEQTWGLGVVVDEYGWGMGGVGGSAAGIDPEFGVIEAYTTAMMGNHDRIELVGDALRECAAVLGRSG
jgi:CubicO group peptidase (beta-lactamase class C family)